MNRQLLFYTFFIGLGFIFLMRLFYVQVIDDSYKISAENNAKRKVRQYPPRGYVYDRNGKVMVANQIAYDMLVVPRQIKDLDTASLCLMLGITREDFEARVDKAKKYSTYKPSPFYPLISRNKYSEIQHQLHKYSGFYTQKRLLRNYPNVSAANVVGFIAEVSPAFIETHPSYRQGDLVGKAGIESGYEDELRGKAGVKYVMVDNHNREKGPFLGGKFDTLVTPGNDLTSTIDLVLQQYGEYLMHGKRGSVVAIEPKTGEILALVTNPGYDPNLLVGRDRSKNYNALYADSINKPLYDRAVLAEYPPGSPFKLVNALVGLQVGVIDTATTFTCNHGFHAGGLTVACHCGGGTFSLIRSISKSCNNYYCSVFKRIVENYPTAQQGVDAWSHHVKSFGLGKAMNNDLPTGRKGLVPDGAYYDRTKGYTNWKAVSVISLGIGQGELLVTPLQMANLAAIIANKGYYITPHVIKKVNGKAIRDTSLTKRRFTTVEPQYFNPVIEGMYQVFESGTARGARLEGLPMCGKTGTAQNPQGQDHSIFLAFAPKDDPKIAIAVFVENGYWGSRWAGPIASLMMEKYITGSVSRPLLEKRMHEGLLYDEYKKQLELKYGNADFFNPNF